MFGFFSPFLLKVMPFSFRALFFLCFRRHFKISTEKMQYEPLRKHQSNNNNQSEIGTNSVFQFLCIFAFPFSNFKHSREYTRNTDFFLVRCLWMQFNTLGFEIFNWKEKKKLVWEIKWFKIKLLNLRKVNYLFVLNAHIWHNSNEIELNKTAKHLNATNNYQM